MSIGQVLHRVKSVSIAIFEIIVGKFIGLFIKRDAHYIIFNGMKTKANRAVFMHNSKYFFLYMSKNKNYKTIFLCDDKETRKIFKSYGYENVYARKSLKGLYYAFKSKYFFCDYRAEDILRFTTIGSTLINLWHGIPLKKCIGYLSKSPKVHVKGTVQRWYYKFIILFEDYYITNGQYENECGIYEFLADDNQMVTLGSPRTDALFQNFDNQEIFMEEDAKNIKQLYDQGKKLIMYMPTFRDTGKDISGWLKSDRLRQTLKDNNAVLLCKIHPSDINSINFELGEEFYKMDRTSDAYPILKYTTGLITDYSSISFDYLLLDKPIIYFAPDMEEYQEKCRGFCTSYENYAAGIVTQTEDEILSAIKTVLDGIDNYKDVRQKIRDYNFKYQDGNNCDRLLNFIEELSKK